MLQGQSIILSNFLHLIRSELSEWPVKILNLHINIQMMMEVRLQARVTRSCKSENSFFWNFSVPVIGLISRGTKGGADGFSTNKSSPGFFTAPWMGRLVTISCFQNFFGIINATYDSSSVTERLFFILRFNNDPSIDILLLTTHVGRLGLNLTGANTVIFVEHDWNPTKDLQVRNHQPFDPFPSPLFIPIFTNFAQALFR